PLCHCHTRVRKHFTALCRFLEAARVLLSAGLVYLPSCFVLCCTCLMFDCVRKVVDSLVCHSVKVITFQEVLLVLAASISLALSNSSVMLLKCLGGCMYASLMADKNDQINKKMKKKQIQRSFPFFPHYFEPLPSNVDK